MLLERLIDILSLPSREKRQVLCKVRALLSVLATNASQAHQFASSKPACESLTHLLLLGEEPKAVKYCALRVMFCLSWDEHNCKRLLRHQPQLIDQLVLELEKKGDERIELGVLGLLRVFSLHSQDVPSASLLPLLLGKLQRANSTSKLETAVLELLYLHLEVEHDSMLHFIPVLATRLHTAQLLPSKILFRLSCWTESRRAMRLHTGLVNALNDERVEQDVCFLTLVNLYSDDFALLETGGEDMLQRVYDLLVDATGTGGDLPPLLLSIRHLASVPRNRRVWWASCPVLNAVLDALQQVVERNNAEAIDNAVGVLKHFAQDPDPFCWIQANKHRLSDMCDSSRAWFKRPRLAGSRDGEAIITRLLGEDLVEAEDLAMLANKNPVELMLLLNLTAKQALVLHKALNEQY